MGEPLAIGALAVAGVAALAMGSRGGSSFVVSEDYSKLPPVKKQGQADLRVLCQMAGLSPNWSMFFEATALNESGFNNLRGLGDPSMYPGWARPNLRASHSLQVNEQEKAERAYRNNSYLKKCKWDAERYTFGSGGWFAMLPAFGVYAFKGTSMECIDPYDVFEKEASLVMAIEFARRTMRRSAFKKNPKYGVLRVGWGLPSGMGDQSRLAASRTKKNGFSGRLEQLGYDKSNWYTKVDPLPNEAPDKLLRRLRREF
jgi:hypothetical protein